MRFAPPPTCVLALFIQTPSTTYIFGSLCSLSVHQSLKSHITSRLNRIEYLDFQDPDHAQVCTHYPHLCAAAGGHHCQPWDDGRPTNGSWPGLSATNVRACSRNAPPHHQPLWGLQHGLHGAWGQFRLWRPHDGQHGQHGCCGLWLIPAIPWQHLCTREPLGGCRRSPAVLIFRFFL